MLKSTANQSRAEIAKVNSMETVYAKEEGEKELADYAATSVSAFSDLISS